MNIEKAKMTAVAGRGLSLRAGLFAAVGAAGAALLGWSLVAPAAAQNVVDPPGLDRAIAAQEFHTDRLLEIDGVVGTGVGVTARGLAAVVIMTEDLWVTGLARSLDGVPVVVKVTGRIYAIGHKPKHNPGGGDDGDTGGGTVDPTSRFDRPVPIGVSTGNGASCSAGTIGARVSKTDGTVYALSNNHIYALENAAPLGSEIHQPGRFDTGCTYDANNIIGTLADFEPIVFSTSANNEIDAAIALSSLNDLGNATPSDGYGTPSSNIVPEFVGQGVQKYGRTTGLTKGTVALINATVKVGYSNGTARFVDQIVVDGNKGGFLNAGDSGSLLVTDPNADPVGLLFASGRGGKIAVANPIHYVLTRFWVSIDGN